MLAGTAVFCFPRDGEGLRDILDAVRAQHLSLNIELEATAVSHVFGSHVSCSGLGVDGSRAVSTLFLSLTVTAPPVRPVDIS